LATCDRKPHPADARLATTALLVYVASTVVRFWYVLVQHHPRHHVTSDAGLLVGLAERLVAAPATQTLSDTIWPPGTSSVLGALMAFDPSLGVAAFVQAAVGVLVPLLIAHATSVALGRRAGWVALALASVHFGLIHYGGLFLSEQLFQLAVAMAVSVSVVALIAVEQGEASVGARFTLLLGAGCGVTWAFACTFRPNALPVALAVGAALAFQALRARRVRLLRMLGAGLLAFVVALAPPAARCRTLKGGGFCAVSSNVAMNMALGQSGELSGLEFVPATGDPGSTTSWVPPSLLQHGYGGIGTVPASIYDTGGVLRWVGGRLISEPGRFFVRATGNMLDLFRLEYWPDDDDPAAERLVTVAKQLFFLAVIAPALVALAAVVRAAWRARAVSTLWCFVLAVVAAVLGSAALSMGEARYRLPFDGVLILCAASLVTTGSAGQPEARAPSGAGAGRMSLRVFAAIAVAAALGTTGVALASSTTMGVLPALARVAERLPVAADATRRPAADFSSPRAAGSAWNADGNHVFSCAPTCRELRLALPALAHAPALELSVDNNDRYELLFYRGDTAVARANVDPHPTAPGLRVAEVQVPAAAVAGGFDAVGVRPLYGDGRYSLGHLVLRP
jgi:hypothetical protein